jgi:endoglucanase
MLLAVLALPTAVAAQGRLLPAGYLSTSGSQIVDARGQPVRIACIGWSGSDGLGHVPQGLELVGYRRTMDQLKSGGFNCIRIPYNDLMLAGAMPRVGSIDFTLNPDLAGLNSLAALDKIIAYAGAIELKIIIDHHTNDGGANGWGGQQVNGLWFDSGPGTDGTDGSNNVGTVTAEKFRQNWVALALRYAGNATVIGFDLHNEPTSAGNINWGRGGPTDLHAMLTTVGNAIQAVNPDALIICEGEFNYRNGAPAGDFRPVATKPVVLNIANKIVYSPHEYPQEISDFKPDSGPAAIARYNRTWGFLVKQNIAPVWIGEMGSSMLSKGEQAWAATLLDYMNGKLGAQGGPTFSHDQQPIGGSWWLWGDLTSQVPQGVLRDGWTNGSFRPEQLLVWRQLLFAPPKTDESRGQGLQPLGDGQHPRER